MENVHGGDIYRYDDVLDFSANINPLGTPETVKRAIVGSVSNIGAYPSMYCDNLRDKLALYYNNKGNDIHSEQIICGNGAADVIFRYAFALRPKNALVISPCFAEYENALKSAGCENIFHYMLNTTTFCIENDIFKLLDNDLDVIFLCNPNNPTGIVVPCDIMCGIVAKCEKKNIKVFIDECFLDFLDKEDEYSYIDRVNTYKNVFVLKAFTKIYAIAGLRLGYGVTADIELIEKMYEVGAPWNVSTLAQVAGLVALDEIEYKNYTKQYVKNERQYLYDEFDKLNIKYWKGEADYIFFKAQDNLKEKLLDKGILIRDCSNYVNLSKGYYRIAVKGHKYNEKLIKALQEVSGGWGKMI